MAIMLVAMLSSFITLFILVMIALKLIGCLDISWVWVFAPIWIPFILSTGLMIIIVAIIITKSTIERRHKNVRNTRRRNQSRNHK